MRLNGVIEAECREVAEEAVREEAGARRELQVVDDLLANMGILREIYE
jgi:hypothetical protein